MPLRFHVIDGADKGRSYYLPEGANYLIGNNHKHADICLHDLYVARVHCEARVNAGRVTIVAHESPGGTLIGKDKITEQEMHVGEVLRLGNSFLRLEMVDKIEDDAAKEAAPKAPAGLPRLSGDKLQQLSGQTLGHYQLGAVLGRGHSGVVFRARDVKKNEDVALKVLPQDFPANEREMNTLVQALKLSVSLRDPHLVTLHSAGKNGPYCWISSELVAGHSAQQVIQEYSQGRKIKWRFALGVALDISRALEFTHRHRRVHGSITPANILISESSGTAKLNDLLAQQALEGSVLQGQFLEKKLLAELPYMSPEQADPETTLVDELSDQYGLGAVLFALLTGKPPFSGDSPEELIGAVREKLPIKPQKIKKNIPDALQAVVLRMLAKRPEERYATPSQLVEDLQHIAQQQDKEV